MKKNRSPLTACRRVGPCCRLSCGDGRCRNPGEVDFRAGTAVTTGRKDRSVAFGERGEHALLRRKSGAAPSPRSGRERDAS
ncbi:hypothetical protein KAR29_01070 [Aminithiophilus ramosus]|uniref:Uncharacterized protein n=2 Tax=Synergistales TaxID=649776 RepID=A0A9Q7A8P6_9BACT|nr:hypothetical protein [Aminithiophilus ramosus]QTX32566.1 hypothetical protein KAR29_01070 [Aminithiophilus ramosus]QVL36446.1 hypothetical protein KIH16_01080 [Synergistota bacterium]